jgi:uncharacterized protein (DUF1330 family)
MAAYWIARSQVLDPVRYMKYAEKVPPILSAHGGVVHVRGGDYKVIEGPSRFTRFVVIEFPSMENALACYYSPEYQAARSFRLHGAGEVEIIFVNGGEFTTAASLSAAAETTTS